MATVLIPVPDRDFDPTEVAVSWRVLVDDGHHIVFATESGHSGVADDIMVTGRGLDLWSALPLVGTISLVGRMLRANKDGRRAYDDMLQSAEFSYPISWAQASLDGIDALLLPGGHRARGMRSYIDSDALHRLVVRGLRASGGRRRDLPRRAACRAQCGSRHRALGALRAQDHGLDLGAGAVRLAAHPHHPVLGSRLLPHLLRRARPAAAATCRCNQK